MQTAVSDDVVLFKKLQVHSTILYFNLEKKNRNMDQFCLT